MKQLRKHKMHMVVTELTIAITFLAVCLLSPKISYAGQMEIEMGSVFTNSMIKDGQRYDVTKTYTPEGIVITQKVFNATTNQLIKESTTVKPLPDNINYVSKNQPQSTMSAPKLTIVLEPTNAPTEKTISSTLSIQPSVSPTETSNLDVESEPDFNQISDKLNEQVDLDTIKIISNSNSTNPTELSVEGIKSEKLLWLIPINISVDFVINHQTGEIVSQKQSTLSKLLDSISF